MEPSIPFQESREPLQVSADPFLEMLPLLLSEGAPELPEPTYNDLDLTAQKRYLELTQQVKQLAEAGKYATGSDVLILVSDVGVNIVETTVEGVEEPLIHYDYFVSEEERDEHLRAAGNIQHQIQQITNGGVDTKIEIASIETIDAALKDTNIAHIIFIGHANRSNLAVEPEVDFQWDQPTKPITHLKKSFGVFGCSEEHEEGPLPRVGLSVLAPAGILYGIPTEFFEEGTPYDFGQLVRLPNNVLDGTPIDSLRAA